jgi:hypothetical protein
MWRKNGGRKMKSTSKKTSGLLGGFDFQPVFSEQTLSRSEPKEEEVSQTKPNNAEQAPIKPSEATDSYTQPSEAKLSSISQIGGTSQYILSPMTCLLSPIGSSKRPP